MSRDTAQRLAAAQDQVARLRHQLSEEKRRADAHRKITLGGLVIAAEADHLDPAVIVGCLARQLAIINRDPTAEGALHQQGMAILDARNK
jgi:hypothetical protein